MRHVNVKLAGWTSLMLLCAVSWSQQDAKSIYDGNQLYHSGKAIESSAKYSKALELNPNNKKANFNLGNSLYKNVQLKTRRSIFLLAPTLPLIPYRN
jgi:hypothetical protein